VHFSRRVPSDLAPNRFALALAGARRSARRLIDLTVSNPTQVGLGYPDDLLAPLADAAALVYDPQPFGLRVAREAVSEDFARKGAHVPADRVVLTASTSEAYSILFKLLCDPGDRVLVPRPSYPLFEHLTRLDDVEAESYLLEYHGRWSVDLDSVRSAISPRTRAILAVSPNNPTGSFLDGPDLDALVAICAEHDLALIGDEVFADFPLPGRVPVRAGQPDIVPQRGCEGGHDAADIPPARPPGVLSSHQILAFSLGGLSKSVGLPQLKLGWVGVGGPDDLVGPALGRLEVICDSYLSVGTPVQQAAGALMTRGVAVRARILARISENYETLAHLTRRYPSCTLLAAEGGWYAVVQVPATESEEDLVVTLLEEDAVVVYPGYFFDFPREAFLIVSLLPVPDEFRTGITRVLERAASPVHGD
jgi:alanine-synthesizing transaminase